MAPEGVRERILAVAATLVAQSGIEGASIREICATAGVTPPAVYHHFGDKAGLLDAVAADGFERYLAEKKRKKPTGSPLDDLRRGWNDHLDFGLRNPVLYKLMYGDARLADHPAAKEAESILRGIVDRISAAGLLRLPVDSAMQTVHAATVGTTILLIANPDRTGAKSLSQHVREAVLDAIAITEPREGGGDGLQGQAEALLITLATRSTSTDLTPGEHLLLLELLTRLAGHPLPRL